MVRQRMGQHFLRDAGWQGRILGALPRDNNDVWIEIGAGYGEMTRLLVAPGRRTIAIEADRRLADRLRTSASGDPAAWPGVEIVSEDVLTLDLAELAGKGFSVYGNLPYYITSPIIRHLFRYADRISSIHVVIQLEVAARIVSSPGGRRYGYLSALCQFYAKPEIVFRIPPGAFRPPPNVASALVRMTLPGQRAMLGVSDESRFLEFVGVCFHQKRKTLRNNLRGYAPERRMQAVLSACGFHPSVRAEQLSLTQFAALFKRLV